MSTLEQAAKQILQRGYQARLDKLETMSHVPKPVLDKAVENARHPPSINWRKAPKARGLAVVKQQRKTGRGGKPFFQLHTRNGGVYNFFPLGKYGPFVSPDRSMEEKKRQLALAHY